MGHGRDAMTEKRLTTPLTPELYCTDIKVSLPFYADILGFSIQYQRPEDGFAMLERQGSRIMLDEIRQVPVTGTDRTWISGTLEKPFGRGINLQIRTDKIDALYDRVQKANANIFLPIEEKWYRADDMELGNRQFIVQDPDGYLLRFFQDLGERKGPV
jgi:catechol 2,3-dioxygenase-like lactoylglutathione lyase family enzyme